MKIVEGLELEAREFSAQVRALQHRHQALNEAKGEVVRPEGWNAANDVPRSWTRPGYLYRGISDEEFRFIKTHGVVRSNEKWSVPGEGTNFDDDAAGAESYVNYGRTDPRKTGKPTYVIEVKKDASFKQWRDGYWKTPEVPKSAITRAWKMVGEGGEIVAYPIRV